MIVELFSHKVIELFRHEIIHHFNWATHHGELKPHILRDIDSREMCIVVQQLFCNFLICQRSVNMLEVSTSLFLQKYDQLWFYSSVSNEMDLFLTFVWRFLYGQLKYLDPETVVLFTRALVYHRLVLRVVCVWICWWLLNKFSKWSKLSAWTKYL